MEVKHIHVIIIILDIPYIRTRINFKLYYHVSRPQLPSSFLRIWYIYILRV